MDWKLRGIEPIVAGRELAGDYNRLLKVLYVLNIKPNIF